MDMDPLTRREAQKIETVLSDLVSDLELITCLPDEFSLWMRDDGLRIAQAFEADQLPDLTDAGGVDAAFPPADPSVVAQRAEVLEELQRLCKASSFFAAAGQYGDPADTAGNEALLQLNEFAELERELLDAATTVGHVVDDDLDLHHLSLRALLDTLRDGGYMTHMRTLLHDLYPPHSAASASSSQSSIGDGEAGGGGDGEDDLDASGGLGDETGGADARAGGGGAAVPYSKKAALAGGMLSESAEAFGDTVRTLARLIRQRNASTVNEDVQRYRVLHEAVNREVSATADVQTLNREYKAVKAARRREVAALDAEIDKLEAEIAYVKKAADVELEAMQEVDEKVRADRVTMCRHRLDQHREAARALEEKFAKIEAQHTEEISDLRSKRAKREAAVSGAIAEYDTQMETMMTAMHRLQKAAEVDTGKVVVLEEQIERLQTEQREYEWEQKVASQRQTHLDELSQRQEQDARVFQAYVRAYLARLEVAQELAAKDKKKKGKKRGGKKK